MKQLFKSAFVISHCVIQQSAINTASLMTADIQACNKTNLLHINSHIFQLCGEKAEFVSKQ